MSIVESFGHSVEKLGETSPKKARQLLKAGWKAQNLKFRYFPDKRLLPADQRLATIMMDAMLKPLQKPEDSVIVSVFTPCELMQTVHLHPYNVESFSCYLTASHAAQSSLQQAESEGIAETLCSYHRVFVGAADGNLLPKPRCIVYTNLVCDANLVTFRYLAERFQVPSFFLDVPMQQNEANVRYVADQLRELAGFLEQQTGTAVEEEQLKERLHRSSRTLDNLRRFQKGRAGKYIPSDLVTPLYASMTANFLLGTEEEEQYTQLLLRDLETARPAQGTRIYWMHTIPFWSEAVKRELSMKEQAQIVGCELSQTYEGTLDPEKPYEAMARRMVYNTFNGSIQRRIDAGIRNARMAGADGAVWFAHWGCKHTLGGAQLAKKKFDQAGIPLLILDGDGCDRSHGGEGQTATRLGAFLEMLGENRHE